jgi:hypothetical protein
MIIEVALGVVLGYVLIKFWQPILAFGIWSAIGISLIAVGGVAFYWVSSNQKVMDEILALSVVGAFFFAGMTLSKFLSKYSVLTAGDIGGILAAFIFLAPTTIFFAWFLSEWATAADEPTILLFMLPLIGLWAWAWRRISKLLNERRSKLEEI